MNNVAIQYNIQRIIRHQTVCLSCLFSMNITHQSIKLLWDWTEFLMCQCQNLSFGFGVKFEFQCPKGSLMEHSTNQKRACEVASTVCMPDVLLLHLSTIIYLHQFVHGINKYKCYSTSSTCTWCVNLFAGTFGLDEADSSDSGYRYYLWYVCDRCVSNMWHA